MEIEKEIKQIKNILKSHEKRIIELENFFLKAKRKTSFFEQSDENLIKNIVDKIKNCEESDKIETQVLDKDEQEGRILLPFYISYKYFSNQPLTTGDVEKITGELGVRIKAPNIANKIKKSLWKYLDSASIRKKGKPTLYRLNRKGAKRFEEILNSKSVERKHEKKE